MDLILDIDSDGVYRFDYASFYHIDLSHFLIDAVEYVFLLEEYGFEYQDAVDVFIDGSEIAYVFFYMPERDISLVYNYYVDEELFLVLIGHGNAYEQLIGAVPTHLPEVPMPPGNYDFVGYRLFPHVPDFGAAVPQAEFYDEGKAIDFGIEIFGHNDNVYIVGESYLFIYYLPIEYLDQTEFYIALFTDDNYQVLTDNYYEEIGIGAMLLYNIHLGKHVSIIYDYNDESIWIAIE